MFGIIISTKYIDPTPSNAARIANWQGAYNVHMTLQNYKREVGAK